MTKTKASVWVPRQRAGGWCEPVREQIFPLSESVMKVTGSYPVSYVNERPCYTGIIAAQAALPYVWQQGNMGGNAEG